jgi:hypothetical protein
VHSYEQCVLRYPRKPLGGLLSRVLLPLKGVRTPDQRGIRYPHFPPLWCISPPLSPTFFRDSSMPKRVYFIDESGNSKPNWPNSRKKTFARGADVTRKCRQSPAGSPEPLRLDAQSHSGCLAYSLHTSPRHVDSTSNKWCIESAHNRVCVAD